MLIAFHVMQHKYQPVAWRQVFDCPFQGNTVNGAGQYQIPFSNVFAWTVLLGVCALSLLLLNRRLRAREVVR